MNEEITPKAEESAPQAAPVPVAVPPPAKPEEDDEKEYTFDEFRNTLVEAGRDTANALKRPYRRLARGMGNGLFGAIRAFSDGVDPKPPKDGE